MRTITRFAALAAMLLLHAETGRAQQPSQPPILSLGNAVVTGFSGTTAPDPGRVPRDKSAIDLTFIDPDAASARIFDVRTPGFAWDGRNWQAPKTFEVFARDAGQVFGIALDDEAAPNIYLTATSAYGLQIVAPGADGTPQRITKGQPRAEWMKGQFGPAQGGPGSIWKVDGRTGQVTLFANVTLNGASNAAPGLGNITYDRAHRQLFVSDLATGMIHRFDLAGREQQTYDHGTAARPARSLPPVAFDPSRRVEITDARFDSENPDSWGFAPPERRVHAVMIRQEGQDTRLYYSVWDGPQIWSVRIRPDGSFGNDARWELDVAATPRSFPVSDMVFSDQGAMILAQRGGIVSSYDYSVFARPGEARVLRYVLEQPDDPATPSRWIARPDEYAIGFRGDFRNTDGGVDLGYGWRDGRFDNGSCATTLWTTGESLRDNPTFSTRLQPGGPFVVNGLQASPVDQVRDQNTPPWTAYFVDYDGRYNDTRASGHIGSVRILRADCTGPVAGVPAVSPPYVPPVGPPPVCPQGLNPDGTCGRIPIDLAIRKTASEGKYDAATGTWTFTFTLAVTNVGNPFTAGNHIVINDPVPNGLTFTAAAGTNWVCPPTGQFPITNPNALSCTYNFGPGQIATGATLPPLVITVTVKNAGKYENCATTGIAGAPWLQETTQQNNRSCATIAVPVDLAIKKGVGEAKYDAATGTWTYQYTLMVQNVGAAISPAGPNVITVTDPVPNGLTFTSATGGNWSCNAPPALSAGTLTCAYTGTGTIAHNQVLGAITITVITKTPGKYDNCATVGVTPASGLQETAQQNNKDCATSEITKPAPCELKVTKSGPQDPGATASWPNTCTTNSACTFNITITNTSQTSACSGTILVGENPGIPMTVLSTNLPCTPPPTSMPFTCPAQVTIGPGGAQQFTIVGTIAGGTVAQTLPPPSYQNCVGVGAMPQNPPANPPWAGYFNALVMDAQDCKQFQACGFTCHMKQQQLDMLKIEKKADSLQCNAGGLCSFTYTITNISNTPHTLPITFVSSFAAGSATYVGAQPSPWTCIPFNSPNDIKCLYPPVPVAPQVPPSGQISVTVTFQISPSYNQPTWSNCAAFFIGTTANPAQQRRTAVEQSQRDVGALRDYLQSRGIAALAATTPVLGPDDKSCATVQISAPKAPIGITTLTCDPATAIKRGNVCVCRVPGMVKSSDSACSCPTGTNLIPGRGCVPPLKCDPPRIPNATNTACVCPEGTLPRGRECVRPPACLPPMIQAPGAPAGTCICPPGTVQRGRECVKPPSCQPPMIQAPGAPAGTCICPPGTVQQGRECVRHPTCQPPLVLVPGPRPGVMVCGCPQGTVLQGRECVRPGTPAGPKGGEPPRGTVR